MARGPILNNTHLVSQNTNVCFVINELIEDLCKLWARYNKGHSIHFYFNLTIIDNGQFHVQESLAVSLMIDSLLND